MLIEIWERLRGYDKWIQTEARIKSSTVEQTSRIRKGARQFKWVTTKVITWTDSSGESQIAQYTVPGGSPMYQPTGGEMVTIHYNPAKPEEFYYREFLRTRVHTVVKIIIGVLLFLAYSAALFFCASHLTRGGTAETDSHLPVKTS